MIKPIIPKACGNFVAVCIRAKKYPSLSRYEEDFDYENDSKFIRIRRSKFLNELN